LCKLDKNYISDLIRDITDGLNEIRDILKLDLKEVITNRRIKFSLRYSIILVAESASDLGLYILRKCLGVDARTYREVFDRLATNNVISPKVAEGMKNLVALRNIVVHRYWEVDDTRIYRGSFNGVSIAENYIREVLDYVSKDP